MNQAQIIIQAALTDADNLTESRGRMASVSLTYQDERIVLQHCQSSQKWVESAHGYMTLDKSIVLTKRGNTALRLGRNY